MFIVDIIFFGKKTLNFLKIFFIPKKGFALYSQHVSDFGG